MKKTVILVIHVLVPVLAFCFTNDSDSAAFYLKIAVHQKNINKTFEADRNYKKAIEFTPNNYELRLEYGKFLNEQHKYFAAFEQFNKVLAVNSSNIEGLDNITRTSFYLKKWADVISFGTRLAVIMPSSRLSYMMGKSFYEEEDYGRAEKSLTESVHKDPTNIEATILLGKVYIELSNYKQALTLFNKALNVDSNNNQLIYELGMLHSTLNQEKEAIRYFELAAEKGYKTDLDYEENLGMAYLGIDINKGIEILNKVLEKKPNDSEIMMQIGQAHYKEKDFSAAADIYYKIYQHDPENSRALYMAGMAQQKNGNKTVGTSLCEKAIRLDPSLGELKRLKYSF